MAAPSLLSRVPIFASLGEEDLRALAGACRTRGFRRGEILFHEGDAGNVLYILESGHVKIVLIAADGAETILHMEGPGKCLGELSLLDGGHRSATAVAVDEVSTLALYQKEFLDLVARHPTVAHAVMKELAMMVRRLSVQVHDVISLDATARIAKKLLELADQHGEAGPHGRRIALRITQEELAQMVGVTRASINKQLGWFQDRGILSTDRDGITLHKPEELRKRIY